MHEHVLDEICQLSLGPQCKDAPTGRYSTDLHLWNWIIFPQIFVNFPSKFGIFFENVNFWFKLFFFFKKISKFGYHKFGKEKRKKAKRRSESHI
jgi:hypothetical protein